MGAFGAWTPRGRPPPYYYIEDPSYASCITAWREYTSSSCPQEASSSHWSLTLHKAEGHCHGGQQQQTKQRLHHDRQTTTRQQQRHPHSAATNHHSHELKDGSLSLTWTMLRSSSFWLYTPLFPSHFPYVKLIICRVASSHGFPLFHLKKNTKNTIFWHVLNELSEQLWPWFKGYKIHVF